jgi:16S rRNA (guanine527-N7)-methyltransferase
MAKWNAVYNLTAIRDDRACSPITCWIRCRSLPLLPRAHRLADIGSGGGLPGIPLAIARPDLQVLSVEPNSKKASFQQQARIDLGLANFDVQTARVEAWQPDPRP